MWVTYFATILVVSLFLYVPGYCFGRALRFDRVFSISLSPLFCLALYSIVAIVFQKIGITCSWVNVSLITLFAGFACLGVSSLVWKGRPTTTVIGKEGVVLGKEIAHLDVVSLIVYILVGLAAGSFVFTASLVNPDSFAQLYDNIYHLNEIAVFATTGDWSCLTARSYLPSESAVGPITNDGAFYPSAWHILVAMGIDATGASTATAINATNFVFSSVVCPVGMMTMMSILFPGQARTILFGSLTALAFNAFPWGFLTFGPLYANLAGYAIVPVGLVLFVLLIREDSTVSARIFSVFSLGVAIVAFFFCQPNAVFTLALVAAPLLVAQAPRLALFARRGKPVAPIHVLIAGIMLFLFVAGCWFLCYKLPFLQGVVSHVWLPTMERSEAIVKTATLTLKNGVPHLMLLVLSITGAISLLLERKHRWLIVSALIIGAFFAFSDSSHNPIKHLMTGFWYTDTFRVAAMLWFPLVPLSAKGASTLVSLAYKALSAAKGRRDASERRCLSLTTSLCVSGLAVAIIAIGAYLPTLTIGTSTVQTPLGYTKDFLTDIYDPLTTKIYSLQEQAFVEKAREIVPEDELVINNPDDGSCFSFAISGFPTAYRFLREFEDIEKPGSETIRLRLDHIATDKEVQDAAHNLGMKYLLLLDVNPKPITPTKEELIAARIAYDSAVSQYGEASREAADAYVTVLDLQDRLRTSNPIFQDNLWTGIQGVTDETPGFEIVLAEGDMRLYRIVA